MLSISACGRGSKRSGVLADENLMAYFVMTRLPFLHYPWPLPQSSTATSWRVRTFATGEAPVAPGVDFLGNKFAVAWAGCSPAACTWRWVSLRSTPLALAIVMCP